MCVTKQTPAKRLGFLSRTCQKGVIWVKKEEIADYYARYVMELADGYLSGDAGYREREAELKAAAEEMLQVLDGLGKEVWLKFDRVLTAHNNCESYAMQMMYVKGVMDASEEWKNKEGYHA